MRERSIYIIESCEGARVMLEPGTVKSPAMRRVVPCGKRYEIFIEHDEARRNRTRFFERFARALHDVLTQL